MRTQDRLNLNDALLVDSDYRTNPFEGHCDRSIRQIAQKKLSGARFEQMDDHLENIEAIFQTNTPMAHFDKRERKLVPKRRGDVLNVPMRAVKLTRQPEALTNDRAFETSADQLIEAIQGEFDDVQEANPGHSIIAIVSKLYIENGEYWFKRGYVDTELMRVVETTPWKESAG